jgi:hypothetical protein
MLTVNLMLWKAKAGIADNTDVEWDRAAAYFFGSGAAADSEHTVYNRAQKRCADYGTCMGSGEAKINGLIAAAFNSKTDATAKQASYDIILQQVKVLYAQNVLKYANGIDSVIGTDAIIDVLAEGQAFYRILAPWMKAHSPDGDKVFKRMFSLDLVPQTANNYNYCIAKKYIDAFVADSSVMGTASLAATALGSLSAASDVTCASDITHGLVTTIATDAGTYNLQSTDNDVGGSLHFSEAVKKVVNLVDGGSGTDIATAFASSSLKGIADGPGDEIWDDFETHHGDNWMSAIITDATSATSSYSTAGAKNEAIEKTLQDSIAMQSIIADLEHASHSLHSHTTAQKNAYWNSAAAKYFGTTAARSYTIYARANKRGANYGQMTGSGSTAYSATNTAILDAFNGAFTEDNMNTIVKNLKVIYTQAALRCAYLVDEDLAEGTDWNKHQAAGFAFYNNIAPYVKAADAAGDNMVGNYFNPKVVPDSYNNFGYCKAKSVLKAYDTAVWNLVGTFENDDKITCPTTLPTEGIITTKAGSYTPEHQIGASLSFAGAVKAVTSLLDANVNYVNVKKVYESVGLSGEAGQKRTGEPYYNAGLKFFKEADWTNTYINTAFDSGSTLATAARLEIIEKTARDNVAVQAIVSDLYKAQAATDAEASKILWDHAAAKYLGTEADRSQTIYGRADKRAVNYGTLLGSGEDTYAKANRKVIDEFQTSNSINTRKSGYTAIVTQIKVIYAQCVLRYAYLIDANLGNYVEYQAEGQAFWKILAPWVNSVDEAGAEYLEGIFSTAHTPFHADHFCHAKGIIEKLELPTADFGDLEGTLGINCTGRTYLDPPSVSAAPATFRTGLFAAIASVAAALMLA